MFFSGLTISFYLGPVLTLIAMCYLPIMFIVIAIFGAVVGKKMRLKLLQSQKLGAQTEETLSAIKLVVAFA